MKTFTGIKDADRYMLSKLDDSDLMNSCSVNKYTLELCNNDFFRNRIYTRYPSRVIHKPENMTWKNYYLEILYWKDKLLKDYNFSYTTGDPKKYYEFFKTLAYKNKEGKLAEAISRGYLDIVKYLVEEGAKINEKSYVFVQIADNWWYEDLTPLEYASLKGHLDIVKYLAELGAISLDKSLNEAIKYGHVDVVKYLIEKGANIHNNDDAPLYNAIDNGNLDIVKYLVEHGADIHHLNDYPLQFAMGRNKTEIADYLRKLLK